MAEYYVSVGIERHWTGYPRGLKKEQISRSAQVGGLCDVYCTLAVEHVAGRMPCRPTWLCRLLPRQINISI